MKQLIVNKKTGFKNLNPNLPVIIRDFRGKLFYSTEGLKPVSYFNLPEGQYFIDKGIIEILNKPVKYKLYPMPKPQRNFKAPFNFSVGFGNNHNKCSILWNEKLILFDEQLKDSTLPELYYILYHEFGHHMYSSEKYADLYSRNMMISKGYNPSQVGTAPLYSLSKRQMNRKKFIINTFTKGYGHRKYS